MKPSLEKELQGQFALEGWMSWLSSPSDQPTETALLPKAFGLLGTPRGQDHYGQGANTPPSASASRCSFLENQFIKLILTLLEYNLHKLKHNPFSMHFGYRVDKCIQLCDYHLNPVREYFHDSSNFFLQSTNPWLSDKHWSAFRSWISVL